MTVGNTSYIFEFKIAKSSQAPLKSLKKAPLSFKIWNKTTHQTKKAHKSWRNPHKSPEKASCYNKNLIGKRILFIICFYIEKHGLWFSFFYVWRNMFATIFWILNFLCIIFSIFIFYLNLLRKWKWYR